MTPGGTAGIVKISPARLSQLEGLHFPAPANYFPTKDEMADYLIWAFHLPVLALSESKSDLEDGVTW